MAPSAPHAVDGSRKEPIEFFFDPISHNAYLAWEAVGDVAARHERSLRPVPVLFAGLLEAWGQLGPAEIPAKRRWMGRDVVRKALDLGIPLAPPVSHPFNPLLALRVCGLEMADDDRHNAVTALLRAAWAQSRDITDREVVRDVLNEGGLPGDDFVHRADTPEAKARIRELTDQAVARDVFGVPTMIVDGKLFWGFDDLPSLDRSLAGHDPVDSYDWSPWSRVTPSSVRPQAPRESS